MASRNYRNIMGEKVFIGACVRTSGMQIALEQKRGGDEIRVPWGAKEMRATDCQEVKKPRDGDHGEGMDSMGLGMAYEDSRGGGEGEYLFCLLTEIQDT